MAFMNQERKAKLAPAVKAVLKRYGVKGTLSTERHSISLNIKSGPAITMKRSRASLVVFVSVVLLKSPFRLTTIGSVTTFQTRPSSSSSMRSFAL
jgi:hypothetical protein